MMADNSNVTKICVFTGAGLGSPLKLPTTNEFADTINNNIRQELLDLIRSFLGTKSNDIEKVLYLLEDFVRIDDFASHIINAGDSNFDVVRNNLKQYKKWANEAALKIKSEIYDLLEKYKNDDAFNLYAEVIKEIRSTYINPSISFFTTNYDLTFENGFAEESEKLADFGIDEIYYGFRGNNKSVYDPSQIFQWENNILEYKKLHGSLDWIIDQRKQQCVRVGVNTKPKNPGDMPLLYPGFKGIPDKQPFIDLHDLFSERIAEADWLLVIGFAFRDQYLNHIFDIALKRNKNLQVLCYNPSFLQDLPDDSKLNTFIQHKNFQHIRQRIEIETNPLNLSILIGHSPVEIISATYLWPDGKVDVTNDIKKLVSKGIVQSFVHPTNLELKEDPAYGVPKTLKVHYRINDNEKELSVEDLKTFKIE